MKGITTMTGSMMIAAIYISCPDCDEVIETDDGSQIIEMNAYDDMPKTIECGCCGSKFRKPSWPAQRAKKTTKR